MIPLVAIILVNYNSFEDTVECVKSLLNIEYDNYKIVVIDNASTEKNEHAIKFLKQHTSYISSPGNQGFSGGNNLGISYCDEKYHPDYFLFLNNDTVVKKDFLTELLQTASHNKDVGIVCGKIYYYDEPNILWFDGGTFDSNYGIADHIHYNKPDKYFSRYEKDIEFATGCLLLIPKSTVDNVGYLDEEYFMYAEDVDYSRRVRNAGFRILYTSASIIYHKVGRSSKNNDFTTYYMIRNNLYIIQKYASKKRIAYLKKMILILKSIIKREARLITAIIAVHDFLRHKTGRKG